jgi:hypothetical protein
MHGAHHSRPLYHHLHLSHHSPLAGTPSEEQIELFVASLLEVSIRAGDSAATRIGLPGQNSDGGGTGSGGNRSGGGCEAARPIHGDNDTDADTDTGGIPGTIREAELLRVASLPGIGNVSHMQVHHHILLISHPQSYLHFNACYSSYTTSAIINTSAPLLINHRLLYHHLPRPPPAPTHHTLVFDP